MSITPNQSVYFATASIDAITNILKDKFPNLTTIETVKLATDITVVEHALLLKTLSLFKKKEE